MRSELKKLRKGQSAIEFMIIFGAIFLFFVSFLIIVQNNVADKARDSIDSTLDEIAFTVQDEIALAHGSIDGYNREFDLPLKIGNFEYEINLTGRSVYIETTNENYAVATPVLNVTGYVQKGANVIRKENGEVFLNVEP